MRFTRIYGIIYIATFINVISSLTGGHEPPPPALEFYEHDHEYKPHEFEMTVEHIGVKSFSIKFNYTANDDYDRYMVIVRYHNHRNYGSDLKELNKTDVNEIILREFSAASYVLCIALYSSLGSPLSPPLSTTGMCVDLLVGESPPIGGVHSSTGLLAPLLMAVAAVLLLIIIFTYYIKKKRLMEYLANHAAKLKSRSFKKQKNDFVTIDIEPAHTPKYDTSNETSHWKSLPILPAIQVDDDDDDGDGKPRRNLKVCFDNSLFSDDDNNQFLSTRTLDDTSIEDNPITSVESLSHLLDDKPWLPNNSNQLSSRRF